MEYFAIAGTVPIHIDDSDRKGDKGQKTIVLLHGYLETLYIWSEFSDMLKQNFRVITLDLPGHGLSGNAPADENSEIVNTMEFDAEVVKEVLDKSGVSEAYIAGHSMGGFVAMKCCRMYPSTFRGLILFNSHPFAESDADLITRKREISVIEAGKLGTIAELSIPKMYCKDNLRRLDDKISETLELCETHDPDGIIASIKGMHRREDMQEFLSNISIPVLFISGSDDTIISAETFNRLREQYPAIKFVLFDKCGHNSFIEKMEESYEQVCQFLC